MNNTSAYYRGIRKDVAALLPKAYGKVLEIGCGEGGFRTNLDHHCEYWGIEPVEPIAQLAADKLDKVLMGPYQAVESLLPNHYFDLVICNDVIEHMADPDQFLQSIQEKMTPTASLVGSIPNVRYIWNLWDLVVKQDWEYQKDGILDRTHLRFFTLKSLKRTLQNHGFSIVEIKGLKGYHPKSIKEWLTYSFIKFICLGKGDIEYLQFGFHVKKTDLKP